jgi:hypothetical protein
MVQRIKTGMIADDAVTAAKLNPDAENISVFRNRIINGAMVIDQRNNGAAVTNGNSQYTVDRFDLSQSATSVVSFQQNAGSVTPPTGFTKYLGFTTTTSSSPSSSEYTLCRQRIEGFNIADLGWGTANAATVTLSFWVRSSLTGTFGGSLRNDGNTRSYPFSYTISAANTWEQKSITVVGDTSGTWLTTNGIGITITFSLGSGSEYLSTANSWQSGNYQGATGQTNMVATNAATWQVTGVQLEKGSTATSFDYRPYGTELALCQRYYYLIAKGTNTGLIGSASYFSSTRADGVLFIPTSMRSVPTFSLTTGASYYRVYLAGSSYTIPSISLNGYTANYSGVYFYNNTNLAGLSNGSGWWESMNASAFIALTAEL